MRQSLVMRGADRFMVVGIPYRVQAFGALAPAIAAIFVRCKWLIIRVLRPVMVVRYAAWHGASYSNL